MNKPTYTKGIAGDAILKDGKHMTLAEILDDLNEINTAPPLPESAGKSRTRAEIDASLMKAVRQANPTINILSTPTWLLDWAEQLEGNRTWYMWLWHNAITAMQCAAWPDRNEDEQPTGGMQWINNHLSQGMWPPEGEGAEEMTANEYWKANAVPFDMIFQASERAFRSRSTATKENQ